MKTLVDNFGPDASRRAFTLIEFPVTIAIIEKLAAMLLPELSRASHAGWKPLNKMYVRTTGSPAFWY